MRYVLPLCLLLVLVVLWQAVSFLGLVNPMFLPSPAEVWDKARHLSRE